MSIYRTVLYTATMNEKGYADHWFIHSGATKHMTPSKTYFSNYKEIN